MNLKVVPLKLEAGRKPIVILNVADAEDIGVKSSGRVRIRTKKKSLTAIVNITTKIIRRGFIGVYEEVREALDLSENMEVDVELAKFPKSLTFIRNKLKGRKLTYNEIYEIVKDIVDGNLSDAEISSFVTTLHNTGLDLDEATSLAIAMVETGEKLELGKKIVADKHSIGGVPGHKITLLLVPIVAACGVTIPKTSSRAITSASGTADSAEVLMPVSLDVEEMKRVVNKTNGCIVWGGAIHLAPADDIFVQIEYPLSIDPLMIPSIMAKKKAVGATHLVIDIPCGRGTKIKTIGDADLLAKDFIEIGKRLNIETRCAVTYGEQPIGYTIGPALEAREALEALMREKNIPDLLDKTVQIAGMLLEMVGKQNSSSLAMSMIKSGKAEKKLRSIIFEQGGDPQIKPDDIRIGEYGIDVTAEKSGFVLWIDNGGLVEVARAAGAPKDKGAGIQLYKKVGDPVKKGEKLFTIFAEKPIKLIRAEKTLKEETIMGVGKRMEMIIHKIKEMPFAKKRFVLER